MSNKRITWKQVGYHRELYLFIIPTLILIVLFQYYPAASGIFHSFYRWNGADIAEFIGLKNFSDILTSPSFWSSFRLAFLLGIWNVAKLSIPIIVAVWIHRCSNVRLQFFYRLLFVVPMVTPPLVITLIWRSFFFEATSGYLNKFLEASGLMSLLSLMDGWLGWGGVFVEGVQPAWLGDPRLIITSCIIWGFPWVGSFAVLTFLSKLQTIPKEIYEAAEIDGADWWTKFRRIEMPLMLGSIYLMLVFVIIGTIKDAGSILILVGIDGGPGGVATVPALFMLRKAFINQEMGAACAIGIVLTLVIMFLQKCSALLLDDGPSRGRAFVRPAFLLIAALAFCFEEWRAIAMLFLLIAIPFGAIFAWLGRFLPARDPGVPARAGGGQGRLWSGRRKDFALRAFKHGGILTVLALAFIPIYLMMIVSGKTNQQFYEVPGSVTLPFHWENWLYAWKFVAPSIANSLVIAITSTFMTMFFGLCGAYFFARYRVPVSGVLWNALLILMMMPTVANLVPLFGLLSNLNLLNTLTALILVGAAGGQAFAIFMLRNFVEEIPRDLFEAAEIDGANHFRQMWCVVLPLCGPILGTIGVMHFITEWNEFILPLIVMRDGESLPVMVQLQRLSGEYIKFFGPMMAGYALASLPIVVLFMFSMKLFVRGMTEGGVKG
jgi:ABC-type glycerol-3-phosphate transport system permease component